jgi:beta-glucanase (GH16 family)
MSTRTAKRIALIGLTVLIPALALAAPASGHAALASGHTALSVPRHLHATTPTTTSAASTTTKLTSTVPATNTSSATNTNCGGQPVVVFDGITWKCTFDSEFTGDSLDTSQWRPDTTASIGFVDGPNACYVNSPANISVANGYLSLTALKTATPFTCAPASKGAFKTQYTSGTVSTYGLFSQTYGLFEFDAEVSSSSKPGLESSFWLYPESLGEGSTGYGPWPASGEIDVAETYSNYSELAIPYIHYDYNKSTVDHATDTNVVTADNCPMNVGQFNEYTLEWTPTEMAIYVNSQLCMVDHWDPSSPLVAPAPFNEPFFLVLTQALGQGANAFNPSTTQLPATTEVRWVRAWQGQF